MILLLTTLFACTGADPKDDAPTDDAPTDTDPTDATTDPSERSSRAISPVPVATATCPNGCR